MTARMFRDDFKARADSEPEQWNEGILVTNPVHVVVARLLDQRSGSFSTSKEAVQNTRIYLPNGSYFPRRSCASASRIGSNVRTDEPAAEPAKRYLVDWSTVASFQGSTEDGHEDFISDAEVL
jgi:hypothetical protein